MRPRAIACCLLLIAVAGCAEEKRQRLWRPSDDDNERRTTSVSASTSASARGDIRDLLDVFDDEPDGAASAARHDDPPPKTSGGLLTPRSRLDPEVEKRYRTESCLAAAKIAELARDHYLESLKGATPSASALPTFINTFTVRAHSCRMASGSRAAKVASIDNELEALTKNVDAVTKALRDAEKYYKDSTYKSDSFVEGRAVHTTIVGLSGGLTSREALERSFDSWTAGLPPPDTAGWSKSRLAGRDYMATARSVSRLLQATPIAIDAIEKGATALETRGKELSASDPDASERLFRSASERFTTSVRVLATAKGLARTDQVRALSEYIRIVDAERRSFERELSPPQRPPLRPRLPPPP